MENPNLEYTVAHRVINDALGNINDDKSLVAERVRDKLFQMGLLRKEQLLLVQVTITSSIIAHRKSITLKIADVSLPQRIHSDLTAKQLLK